MRAASLHHAQLLSIAGVAVIGILGIIVRSAEILIPVLVSLPFILLSLILSRAKHLGMASFVYLFLVVVVVVTSQLVSAEGIHSIATLLYPVSLTLAARFLSRRTTVAAVILMIISTGVIAVLEYTQTITTIYSINKRYVLIEDFFILSMIIIIAAIASRMTVESLFKNIERATQNEERYRLISNVSSDYAFESRFDENGKLTNLWVAGAFESISGYSLEEFQARGGWRASIHPDDLAQDDRDMADLLDNKKVDSRLRVCTKDGQVRWVRVLARPIWNHAAQRLEGIYGAVQNISEQVAADEQVRSLNADLEKRVAERTRELETALEELENFSYTISHDLRAPLRAVNGYTGILLQDHRPSFDNQTLSYIKLIESNARRMGVMIDGLLTFLRLNRQSLQRQTINTDALVRRIVTLAEAHEPGRVIDICIGDLPDCNADAELLAQVFTSLLSNAIKYSRERSPSIIEIGAQTVDNKFTYFVRDNGVGFDMKYQEKLFGVFQKLHQVQEFEGEGLSLAIVQRIVQRHGGQIWAEAAVGMGATFYFTLE